MVLRQTIKNLALECFLKNIWQKIEMYGKILMDRQK